MSEKIITELSYAGRGFTELPAKVAQRTGETLRKLDLSENSLKTGEGLEGFKVLQELILDRNKLSNMKHFPKMESVVTLWVNNNNFKDSETLISEIANKFPNLNYLSMMFNPCVPNVFMDEAAANSYKHHRYYCISRLHNLQFLDASPVTEEERKQARESGPLIRIAKPKSSGQPRGSTGESPPVHKTIIPTEPPRAAAFLAKGKPRYDGTNSEGNRFIGNDDL